MIEFKLSMTEIQPEMEKKVTGRIGIIRLKYKAIKVI